MSRGCLWGHQVDLIKVIECVNGTPRETSQVQVSLVWYTHSACRCSQGFSEVFGWSAAVSMRNPSHGKEVAGSVGCSNAFTKLKEMPCVGTVAFLIFDSEGCNLLPLRKKWLHYITVFLQINFPDYAIILYIAELVWNYFPSYVMSCVVGKIIHVDIGLHYINTVFEFTGYVIYLYITELASD